MAGSSAFGTSLSIDNGVSDIANLTNIGGLNVSVDTIDTSTHESADAYKEYVAGMLDAGEVAIAGNVSTAANANIIKTAMETRAECDCIITYPTTPAITWTFDGLITGFEMDAPHDGKIGFSGSIKATGKPTIA